MAPSPQGQSNVLESPLLRQVSEEQPKMEQVLAQRQQVDASKQPKKTIMKPEPEVKPLTALIMDDEPFYEEVAKEIEADSMKPGLWTKAFTEADGDEERRPIADDGRLASGVTVLDVGISI